VAPAAVVKALDVLEDRVRELDPRAPPLAVQQLDLHASPERLHDRVVVRVSDGAERGQQPALFALVVKVQEVNWVPRSPWMIAPGEGRRESMAMPRAFVARSARWAVPIAQPTTRRLNTSITTQQ
jgi:hypothetical protein